MFLSILVHALQWLFWGSLLCDEKFVAGFCRGMLAVGLMVMGVLLGLVLTAFGSAAFICSLPRLPRHGLH